MMAVGYMACRSEQIRNHEWMEGWNCGRTYYKGNYGPVHKDIECDKEIKQSLVCYKATVHNCLPN